MLAATIYFTFGLSTRAPPYVRSYILGLSALAGSTLVYVAACIYLLYMHDRPAHILTRHGLILLNSTASMLCCVTVILGPHTVFLPSIPLSFDLSAVSHCCAR